MPQRADDQGYFIGLPGTADDVFPFEPPGTAVAAIDQHNSCVSLARSIEPFCPINVPMLVSPIIKPVEVLPAPNLVARSK